MEKTASPKVEAVPDPNREKIDQAIESVRERVPEMKAVIILAVFKDGSYDTAWAGIDDWLTLPEKLGILELVKKDLMDLVDHSDLEDKLGI